MTVEADDSKKTSENGKSGLQYFEYTVDGGRTFNKVGWSENPTFKISENGDYTGKIFARVTDNAGNVSENSESYTVKLNKTQPVIDSASVENADSWTNNDVKIVISAHDDISGLADSPYSFDGGKSWQASNMKICTQNTDFVEDSIQVKNASGLVSTHKNEVNITNIDKSKPNKPSIVGVSEKWQPGSATLEVVADDSDKTLKYGKSGIDYFEYSLDGGNSFKDKIYWSDTHSFTITEIGDFTNKVAVRVVDKAGNISDLSDMYTVKIREATPFSEEDSETLVKIEAPAGVFPENSRLQVKKLEADTLEHEKTFKGLDENIKSMSERNMLFEISVVDDVGNLIQPNAEYGLATVKIPIPDDFDKDDLEVYRIQYDLPDDSFEEYVTQENGEYYCKFQTDHFSPYILVDKINETQNDVTDNKKSIYWLLITASIVTFAIFAAVYVMHRRKKTK